MFIFAPGCAWRNRKDGHKAEKRGLEMSAGRAGGLMMDKFCRNLIYAEKGWKE